MFVEVATKVGARARVTGRWKCKARRGMRTFAIREVYGGQRGGGGGGLGEGRSHEEAGTGLYRIPFMGHPVIVRLSRKLSFGSCT